MAKTVMFNGRDYTSYFTPVGYDVSYTSIKGQNAGYMLDATYTEDERDIKAVINLPCMPLNEEQLATILSEVYGKVYHMFTYYDPLTKADKTIEARRTVSRQRYKGFGADGSEYWTGTVITMTER